MLSVLSIIKKKRKNGVERNAYWLRLGIFKLDIRDVLRNKCQEYWSSLAPEGTDF